MKSFNPWFSYPFIASGIFQSSEAASLQFEGKFSLLWYSTSSLSAEDLCPFTLTMNYEVFKLGGWKITGEICIRKLSLLTQLPIKGKISKSMNVLLFIFEHWFWFHFIESKLLEAIVQLDFIGEITKLAEKCDWTRFSCPTITIYVSQWNVCNRLNSSTEAA